MLIYTIPMIWLNSFQFDEVKKGEIMGEGTKIIGIIILIAIIFFGKDNFKSDKGGKGGKGGGSSSGGSSSN